VPGFEHWLEPALRDRLVGHHPRQLADAQDLRGNGASGGARQRVDSAAQLVGDAELALAEAARRNPGVPLFLYGHSMGGLVAAHVAARDAAKPRLAGVVLSSAALALPPSASGGARAVVGTLSRLAPELPLEAVDEAQVVREPAARAELAQQAASTDKKLVIYAPALHSLLHEPEGAAAQGEVVAFVDARAARP
jgi:alpha-beta hydrolase superfamily lysophospholipase